MKTCAVIPAAGRGSRLGGDVPKILLPLTKSETVWSILRRKLVNVVDHIHIIVSPATEKQIRIATLRDIKNGLVSLSVQPEPIGMGDAIFKGYSTWSQANIILVVWGDQVFISEETLKQSVNIHAGDNKTIVLPLTQMKQPYVEYILDSNSCLTDVKQSREGDVCSVGGLSDVGTFVLSVNDLFAEWKSYLEKAKIGAETNEINFLPFLPFLSNRDWAIKKYLVENVVEARGINVVEDLHFFKDLYGSMLS